MERVTITSLFKGCLELKKPFGSKVKRLQDRRNKSSGPNSTTSTTSLTQIIIPIILCSIHLPSGIWIVVMDCVLDGSLLHVPRAAAWPQPASHLLHHSASPWHDHGENYATDKQLHCVYMFTLEYELKDTIMTFFYCSRSVFWQLIFFID